MFSWFRKESSEEKKPEFGNVFLYQFPEDQLWRLVVDQRQKGWSDYENREPGSIRNVLAAHQYCLTAMSEIDTEFYKNIHTKCKGNIVTLQTVKGGEFISKETHGFPLHVLSIGGLMELGKFANNYPQLKASFLTHGVSKSSLQSPNMIFMKMKVGSITSSDVIYCVTVTKESSEEITKNIFTQLNSALKESKNDNDIIRAIIDCVYDLEHLHPFDDVNLRSCIVLANVLLMKYGFPPVTYFNPNELDGVSKGEFFEIIKAGMVKTLEIIQKPNSEHFGFILPKLTGADKAKYDNIIDPIVKGRRGETLSKGEIAATYKRIGALESYPEPQWIDKYGEAGRGLLLSSLPEEPPSTWSSKNNLLSLKLSKNTGSWSLETPRLSPLNSSFSSFSILSRMGSNNSNVPETPLMTPNSGSFESFVPKDLKGEPDQALEEVILEEEEEEEEEEENTLEEDLDKQANSSEGRLVLLIGDHPENMDAIKEMLQTANPYKPSIIGGEEMESPIEMVDFSIQQQTKLRNRTKDATELKRIQKEIDQLNAIKTEFEKTIQVNTQKVGRRQGPG